MPPDATPPSAPRAHHEAVRRTGEDLRPAHIRARDRGQHGGRSGAGMPAAAFAGVGIQLGLTFALFALLGWWLDKRLGTSPWLLLTCVVIGATGGLYGVYRRVIGSSARRPPAPPAGAP